MTELSDLQQRIVKEVTSEIFILEDHMGNTSEYKNFIAFFYERMKQGFEVEEFRRAPIRFKIHKDDEKVYDQSFTKFIVILKFLYPFVKADAVREIRDKHIVDCTLMNSKYITNYINKYIVPMYTFMGMRKTNAMICDMLFELSKISTDFSIIIGNTVSIYGFMDLAKASPRFNELIHTKLDPRMQPSEIEEYLNKLTDEEMNIIMNTDCELRSQIYSSNMYSPKQLREVTISGGLKPGVGDDTMAVPINSNLLVGGYKTIKDHFISAKGGRKPYILNNSVMGTTGYFSNKCRLLVSDIVLSHDNKPCNSVNLLKIELKTEDHFKRYLGRMFYDKTKDKFVPLSEKHNYLIGEFIYVKSPITCNHPDGICPYCYGPILYNKNQNIMVGAYAAAKEMNPINQKVLSSKHVMVTDSSIIAFNDEFNDYFIISSNGVMLKQSEEYGDFEIRIDRNKMMTVDSYDSSSISYYIEGFEVVSERLGISIEIRETQENVLFITPEFEDVIDEYNESNSRIISVPFEALSDLDSIFVIAIENEALVKPLYDIMSVLDVDKARVANGITDINSLVQVMIDLNIKADINLQAVHVETMLRPMIRSVNDNLVRPNFAKIVTPKDYRMLTVSRALEKHQSVLIGLSHEQLSRQLNDPDTYRKSGTSFVDPFFSRTMN